MYIDSEICISVLWRIKNFKVILITVQLPGRGILTLLVPIPFPWNEPCMIPAVDITEIRRNN